MLREFGSSPGDKKAKKRVSLRKYQKVIPDLLPVIATYYIMNSIFIKPHQVTAGTEL
jgi:hypothetical protein